MQKSKTVKMTGAQFGFGSLMISVFGIVTLLIGGVMLLWGCASIPQADLSAIHQPKQTVKNIFSSGDSGRSRVTLTWVNILHANWYNIYLSKTPGAKNNGKKISFVDTNPVTITDLELGTTYYFVVTAESAEGESASSEEISYTVLE